MTKDEYIGKIVCEYWFGFKSWRGVDWEYGKKQLWVLGMRSAWNIINPENQISKRKIVTKATIWSREEAEQWYTDYINEKEKDDGSIEDRFDILGL